MLKYILTMLGALVVNSLPVWAADQYDQVTDTAERLQEIVEEVADNAKRLQQEIEEETADQNDQVTDTAERLRQEIEE